MHRPAADGDGRLAGRRSKRDRPQAYGNASRTPQPRLMFGADTKTRARLGVYVDDVYRIDAAGRVSADRAFLLFACEVGRRFERFVLFGRTVRSDTPADYFLPVGTEVVELPHYSSLNRLGEVLRAAGGTVAGMWRGLSSVDVVWVFGPHPFAVVLVVLAAVRRKRIVLGVRMESVQYYRSRFPSRFWRPAILPIVAIDRAYRLLARRYPATVVGADLVDRYGGARTSLLQMVVSLVREREVPHEAPSRNWDGPIELLTVGRIEPEKNPLLLVEALARLERRSPGRFRLTWVGRGELEPAVRKRAESLGVAGRLRLIGYVPFGPELLEMYRSAHAFVHVSLTEGVPQVLVEALATGTPVIATDVGGVGELLAGGRAGVLLPPNDVDALVEAVHEITDEPEKRERMVAAGLEMARRRTLEREAERVAEFVRGATSAG